MRWALIGAVILACLPAIASAATPSNVSYWSPTWSPDGRQIAFLSRDDDAALLVMNADGSDVQTLVARPGVDAANAPDWSPDGRWIAYQDESERIVAIHPDGSGRRVLGRGNLPSWSPRGRKIAFECCPAEANRNILVAAGAGGRPQVAARPDRDGPVAYHSATWSADGERLAFSIEDRDEPGEYTPHWLGVISRFGGPVSRIRTGNRHPQQPDWSPAGGRIVFTDADSCICSVDLRTHRVRKLFGSGNYSSPHYSRDGKRIVFGWEGAIWTMNADGSNRRRVLP